MKILQLKYDPSAENGTVTLPLSKSIALRALTLNAVSGRLGNGIARIPRLPDAGDVKGMERALRLYEGKSDACRIVNIGEGGAPFRFFTALAASTPGVDLSVSAGLSLSRRPLLPFIRSLRRAGADIRFIRREGYPPLRIKGRIIDCGSLEIDPGVSSQFLSALMMAAPLWKTGVFIPFDSSKAVSLPYLRMTELIMKRFGCDVTIGDSEIRVAPGKCAAPEIFGIEPDWSAASYFYELALLRPGRGIRIESLADPCESLQGDSRCAEIFAPLGVRTIMESDGSATLICERNQLQVSCEAENGIETDLNGTPDLAPALAVAFCMAGIRFRFSGVAHLRHKETDRMQALCVELRKLGFILEPGDDTLAWSGMRCERMENPVIDTYSDHRMAMAFAPATVALTSLRIENPEVVGKSFPRYWENLAALGFFKD